MHILVIGSQYIVSINNNLHPKAFRPLNVQCTTGQLVGAMYATRLSHIGTFGREFTG
jgi:hypothetical protein